MNTAVSTDNTSLSGERFGFTLFVSICLHVVLILGVGFTVFEKMSSSNTLEITLAQYRSEEAPENADFLAQENQQGSGTLEEKAAPSTQVQSRFNDNVIQEVSPYIESSAAEAETLDLVLTTQTDSRVVNVEETREEVIEEEREQPVDNLTDSNFEDRLASLKAQLDIRRQAYAKRPRRYTISSASTQKARDILYLDNWRKKVEAVGNLNYPAQASAQGIHGNLRLLVSILADGSISDVRVLSSSGHRILDEAASQIVHLAAPFEPFPPDMEKEIDVLDIIRTWQFQRNNQLSSF